MQTQEGRNLPVPHCIKDTDGWKLDEKVQAALDKKEYKHFKAYYDYIDSLIK